MEIGRAYWHTSNAGSRVFIPGQEGPKWITGLVIEADGLHTMKVPARERLEQVRTPNGPYRDARVRGHLRKMKAVTKEAKKLKKIILDGASS